MAGEPVIICPTVEELPYGWQVKRLGSFCTKIGTGATPRGGSEVYLNSRISHALVRSQHVFDRHFDSVGLAFISDSHAKELRNAEVQSGDVLLNITGDGVTFGRSCIVPDRVLPACVNQHVSIIRPDRRECDPGYLLSVLTHPATKGYIESFNSGGSRRAITKGHIESFAIPLPPLAEQKAIAAVLGALDDKIELNRRMNATLEEMARAVFQSWFVDFDPVRAKLDGRPPAALDPATAALFPSTFQESSIGHVPTGWTVGSLADLMDIQGGTQPPASEFLSEQTDGYVRLVQIRDYESESHLTFVRDTSQLRKCRRDDVMIARYGASVARICWGLEGAYNVALVKAAPRKPCFREFLRSYLQAHDFQARLIGMSNRSVQAGFNKGDIASFQISIPPDELLEKYQTTAWKLRKRILHNKDESRTLATLRDTLLPKLLSGELSPARSYS